MRGGEGAGRPSREASGRNRSLSPPAGLEGSGERRGSVRVGEEPAHRPAGERSVDLLEELRAAQSGWRAEGG